MMCPEAESNHRHEDFQSSALPTELSGQKQTGFNSTRRKYFVSRKGTPSFINKRASAFFKRTEAPLNTEKRGMERWFFFFCVVVVFLYLYIKPVEKLYGKSVLILSAGEISVVAVCLIVPVLKPRLEVPHGLERRQYERRSKLVEFKAQF